jgi:hypothetical protein
VRSAFECSRQIAASDWRPHGKYQPVAEPVTNVVSIMPNAKCRHTMATAICGSVGQAAPGVFFDPVKRWPVAGQSPLPIWSHRSIVTAHFSRLAIPDVITRKVASAKSRTPSL